MEDKDKIGYIYRKYLEGNCNEEEEDLLFNYFHTSDEKMLKSLIRSELKTIGLDDADATYAEKVRLKRIHDKIKGQIEAKEEEPVTPKKYFHGLSWWHAAATIGVFCCLYAVYYGHTHRPPDTSSVQHASTGTSKALSYNEVVLVIGGDTLLLDKKAGGIVLTANGITDELGNTVFCGALEKVSLDVNVAKGAQCRIKLSDGTRIWMNSCSKLSFPGTFEANERVVNLEGEAYFEVAKQVDACNDLRSPFIVQSPDQRVVVMGTRFNVKAYDDETTTRTTLVEGSVKIVPKTAVDSVLLIPNKESYVCENGKVKVQSADLQEALAWKRGEFKFNGEDIYHVMRKIARQYDIDVTYADNVSKEVFVGVISQKEELSQLLDMLSSIGNVQFKLNGREVFVSSNY